MEYSTNMPNFIRDLRKEFADLPQDKAKPKLPFSIGASGMGGYTDPPNLLGKYVIPAQVGTHRVAVWPPNTAWAECSCFPCVRHITSLETMHIRLSFYI